MTRHRFGIGMALLLMGCGGGAPDEKLPAVVPVSGVVLLDDAPVEGATVTFIHAESERNAIGKTDAKGEFKLTTFKPEDGAMPGTNSVVVSKYDEPVADANGILPEPKNALPKKYESLNPVQFSEEVKSEGENRFTLKLSSK